LGKTIRAIFCSVLACAFVSSNAYAELTVLVIDGGDATQLSSRARAAINEALMHEGFAVFDENSFDAFKQTRRAVDSEFIKAAQSLAQPVDALVIFAVQAAVQPLTYTTNLSARVSGRVINARTGQSLGAFDMPSPEGWKVPITCESSCVSDALGKSIDISAGNLGAAVGEKIALIVPPPKPVPPVSSERIAPVSLSAPIAPPPRPKDYTLVFSGFAADERADLTAYLHAFPGYRRETASTDASGAVTYTYDTAADAVQLDRSLHMMLDRIGVAGSVTFTVDAKTFAVKKDGK